MVTCSIYHLKELVEASPMVCRMPRFDALGRFESIFCDISFGQLQGIFLTINMYLFISQSTQNFSPSVLFWVLCNNNDFLRSKKNFEKFFFRFFLIHFLFNLTKNYNRYRVNWVRRFQISMLKIVFDHSWPAGRPLLCNTSRTCTIFSFYT